MNKGLPLYEAKVVRDPTASQRGKTQTNAASYAEEGGSVVAERPTGRTTPSFAPVLCVLAGGVEEGNFSGERFDRPPAC